MSTPQIAVSDNFLSPQDQQAVWDYLKGPGWAFGAFSDKERGSRYFYKHFAGYHADPSAETGAARFEQELLAASPLIAGVWERLKSGLLLLGRQDVVADRNQRPAVVRCSCSHRGGGSHGIPLTPDDCLVVTIGPYFPSV